MWKHQEGHVSANEILENTGALFIARNFGRSSLSRFLFLKWIDDVHGSCVLVAEKCRIGIRRSSGSAIGFVFADKNISLLEFRSEIHEQVCNCDMPRNLTRQLINPAYVNLFFMNSQLLEGEFLFCDKNGWPVQKGQEDVLAGWDVISQGVVTLQLPLTKPPTPCLLKGNKDSRKRRKQR